jgi:hypothetical protein
MNFLGNKTKNSTIVPIILKSRLVPLRKHKLRDTANISVVLFRERGQNQAIFILKNYSTLSSHSFYGYLKNLGQSSRLKNILKNTNKSSQFKFKIKKNNDFLKLVL